MFEAKVRAALEGRPEVANVVEPLLAAWRAVRDQVAGARPEAHGRGEGRSNMPSVDDLSGRRGNRSLPASVPLVEAPSYFRHSRSIGAYLGLTPRRNQSGEINHSGGVSKRGDQLFEATCSRLRLPSRAGAALVCIEDVGIRPSCSALASSGPQLRWLARSVWSCTPCGKPTSHSRHGRRQLPSTQPDPFHRSDEIR